MMKYVLRIIEIDKNKGARKIPSAFAIHTLSVNSQATNTFILSEKKAVQLPHVTYPLNLPCFHEFLL